MEKTYPLPSIVWLKMPDYMHGWLQYELGCAVRIKDQRVVCVQHLPGAREILRMETVDDVELNPMKIGSSMSATRKNVLDAGLVLDASVIEREYGITPETMKMFVPIECPQLCLTPHGVLRLWTLDVNLGRHQANELQRLLRTTFWQAVEEHNADYARRMDGAKYPTIEMIEDFCRTTGTPDVYIEAIKREWNRRTARGDNKK